MGTVRNIVDYGVLIDLGCVDGLLHLSGIPGAVNGMIGEKLTKGDEIEARSSRSTLRSSAYHLGFRWMTRIPIRSVQRGGYGRHATHVDTTLGFPSPASRR